MRRNTIYLALALALSFAGLLGCQNDDGTTDPVNPIPDSTLPRNFDMGFTSWPYAPTIASVEDTYSFIRDHADIYSEHIDTNIPWRAWMDETPLPEAFTADIEGRAARRLPGTSLTLSVSLLNSDRNELAPDYDGTVPAYVTMDDPGLEDAYYKHLEYIATRLNPDYLLVAIEVNELLIHAPEKWDGYKALIAGVSSRLKERFPSLRISESFTLHNFFRPDVPDPDALVAEIATHANSLDFVAISFYPYFKGLQTREDFQEAFDFLHGQIAKPIVIAETGHLSEDLDVPGLDLFIPGNESEQNVYLETLLENAQDQDYGYLIWWTHRDYDALWEVFPEDQKDFGKLWISTGVINEDGRSKTAFDTWAEVFGE